MKKILVLLIVSAFLFSYCGKPNKNEEKAYTGFNKFMMEFDKLNPEQKKAATDVVAKELLKTKKNSKAFYSQQIGSATLIVQIIFYVGCNQVFGNNALVNDQQQFKDTMDDLKSAFQRLGNFDEEINSINQLVANLQSGVKTIDQLKIDYLHLAQQINKAMSLKEKDYYSVYNIGMDTVELWGCAYGKVGQSIFDCGIDKVMQDAVNVLTTSGHQNSDAYGYYAKINQIIAKSTFSDQDYDDLCNLCAKALENFGNAFNQ